MRVTLRDLNWIIYNTRLGKVEFSFSHVKQIELKLILCYNKVIDKQEFFAHIFIAEKGLIMKLLFIIGNAAVGKMTVGQELMKLTGLRLFHNHMTIEPIIEIFGQYNGKAINRLRQVVFEEFAKSDCYGMIFTYMWAFDQQADWDYIEYVKSIFEPYNTEFYYVELVASREIRLKRNITENRLQNKASKRDIELSNKRLINDDTKYRLESFDGEIPFENYIKIDNAKLPPDVVAKMIQEKFNL